MYEHVIERIVAEVGMKAVIDMMSALLDRAPATRNRWQAFQLTQAHAMLDLVENGDAGQGLCSFLDSMQ